MSPTADRVGRERGFAILVRLARAELLSGLAGLKLFIAAIALGTAMLSLIWLLAAGVADALNDKGDQILGGDLEIVVSVPLSQDLVGRLAERGRLSVVADMRSSVRFGERSAPVELRAVDDAYPLYGTVVVSEGDVQSLITHDGTGYGAVVETTLLDRLDAAVGDTLLLGDIEVTVRATLNAEPDRLGIGAFMVGPRMLISDEALDAAGLLAPGALVDHRYRLARPPDGSLNLAGIRALEPDTGWRMRTPERVTDRVRRAVDRTTTFMGIAGVAAMAVAISGAWSAAGAWVRKRGRTAALYRLSGANRSTVALLHGIILIVAAIVAIVIGILLALPPTAAVMSLLAAALPASLSLDLVMSTGLTVAGVMLLGVAGAAIPAIAAAAGVPPGAAMRSGEGPPARVRLSGVLGALLVLAAMAISVTRLPDPTVASIAAAGLAAGAIALALVGRAVAAIAARFRPRGFVGLVALRALSDPRAAAAKAVAIGIGIAAITTVDSLSAALDAGIEREVPQRLPSLLLIDVQPDQKDRLDALLAETPGLRSVSLQPNLRANIRTVNGDPARNRLIDFSEGWVLNGDHGLSWTDAPLPGRLIAGRWWPADYDGPMLLSISDDVADAFGIGPGDQLGFSVLGRVLTGEVANVRDLRWQAIGANYIIIASPNPLRMAPHNWVATVEGSHAAVDSIIRATTDEFPNVTAIDVRVLLEQLADLAGGAADAALAIALALLVAGGIALAAVIGADADARMREGLAFALVGASRTRIAIARLAEVACIGLLAALLGGAVGIVGGLWLAEEAMRVEGVVDLGSVILPVGLGVVAALSAGLVAGVIAIPRRHLIARLAG
ncbi:MAG: ABC transporter permease [Alphaproteobacteria bacterium]